MRNKLNSNLEFGHVSSVRGYAVRMVGFTGDTNWLSFDENLPPTAGWHRLRAVVSLTNTVVTLDLRADGTIDRTITATNSEPPKAFTSLLFGGIAGRKSHGGPILFDNIRVTLVPVKEPATLPGVARIAAATTAPESHAIKSIVAPPAAAPAPREIGSALWWIVGALGVIIGLLVALLLVLRRRADAAKTSPSLGLALAPEGHVGAVTVADAGREQGWRS
ncbi:MAG: hypothetical protein EXS35_13410 [Pedosphaera sp.]|nr:hypothetical protein [Pedosphaera sp.]